jgi:hypothetical protein
MPKEFVLTLMHTAVHEVLALTYQVFVLFEPPRFQGNLLYVAQQ